MDRIRAYDPTQPPLTDGFAYFDYGLHLILGAGLVKSELQGLEWVQKAADHGLELASSVLPQLILAPREESCQRNLDEAHEREPNTVSVEVGDPRLRCLYDLDQSQQVEAIFSRSSTFDPDSSYPQESVKYPKHFGMLRLANHRTLHHKLDNPKLWLSNHGFVVPFQSSNQILNLLRVTTDGSQEVIVDDELYLLSRTRFYGTGYDYVLGSVLHFAALWRLPESVKVLISRGYNVNAENSHAILTTPLLCAAAAQASGVIDVLIGAGASPNPPVKIGRIDCQTPGVFHHLVEWEDEREAIRIARRLVDEGGDINLKCSPTNLKGLGPAENGHSSITPLQYAVKHEKPALVETFIDIGARFGTKPIWNQGNDRVSLLETPSTNLRILELYFHQLQRHKCVLPPDFSESPLGLLLDEDDGPQRRVRKGFSDPRRIIEALDLLLILQPGVEIEVFSAIVRHDHIILAEHVLKTRKWSTEMRWKGMTTIHLAVLHGRSDICSLLLRQGADPKEVTERRRLTCLHLLALMPRHPQVDDAILQILPGETIDADAREAVDGLTAFQIAIRNGKAHLIDPLMLAGADILLPLYDRLGTLAEGRYGCLKDVITRPQTLVKDVHILAEVLWQFHQDSAYSLEFVVLLLQKCLAAFPDDRVLYVDSRRTISILHIVATMFGKAFDSIFPIVRNRFGARYINVQDANGDTPLHYAAAARKLGNIRSLIENGASTCARNHLQLMPHELMAWSVLYLSGRHFKFSKANREPWFPNGYYLSWDKEQEYKHEKKTVQVTSELREALNLFEEHGHTLDQRLERLVLGWDGADMPMGHQASWQMNDDKIRMQLIPIELTKLNVKLPHELCSNDSKSLERHSVSNSQRKSRSRFYNMTFSTSRFDRPYTRDYADYVTQNPDHTEKYMYLKTWEEIYPGDGEADADGLEKPKMAENDDPQERKRRLKLRGFIWRSKAFLTL